MMLLYGGDACAQGDKNTKTSCVLSSSHAFTRSCSPLRAPATNNKIRTGAVRVRGKPRRRRAALPGLKSDMSESDTVVRRSRHAIEMLQAELEAERLRHVCSVQRCEAESAERAAEGGAALQTALAEIERLKRELELRSSPPIATAERDRDLLNFAPVDIPVAKASTLHPNADDQPARVDGRPAPAKPPSPEAVALAFLGSRAAISSQVATDFLGLLGAQ